jgi:hypothetical protein
MWKVSALTGALAALAPAAYSGGFWLEVELPKKGDTRMKDAVLVFRADGCHGPGSGVTGTAEGIVNGKRKSIPLKIKSLGNETFTVARQWPQRGRWALAITAVSRPNTHEGKTYRATSSVVVELTDSGEIVVAQPHNKADRAQIAVRRPNRETLAQLVDMTLKSYDARRAAL